MDKELMSECANCGKVFSIEELEDISDFWGRVLPGETMPSGQCPECGCLCHPIE
jgi:hypothetical protein